MGCFLGCFKGPKDRKRRRSPKKSLPLDQVPESYGPLPSNLSPKQITSKPLTPTLSPSKPAAEVAADALPELKEVVEPGIFSSTRKKVTFDLNVKTYEEVAAEEDPNCSSEDDEGIEAIDEQRKPSEGQDESSPMSAAFLLNHRYQNCASSDDDEEDEEDEDDEDSDFDDEEDNEVGIERNEEESYDSFFSLPIDKEPPGLQEVNSPKPKRAPSPDRQQPILAARGGTRDRSQFVHPVLNPVENLSQWKEVKVRAEPAKIPCKENITTDQENKMAFVTEPALKVKKPKGPNCSTKQVISVDASLSNWLLSSENSNVEGPQASNSCRSNSSFSREDRPILGALSMEDIKQSSATSTPRRSPSKSPPDEVPILGTVGSYWNCEDQEDDDSASRRLHSQPKGIPNTTSKYREDKTVNWHSTPFEVRLERALKNGAAPSLSFAH